MDVFILIIKFLHQCTALSFSNTFFTNLAYKFINRAETGRNMESNILITCKSFQCLQALDQ
jgi:hypothetical protein